ncbi:MAG: ATP-binding cassette domain-containing protein [Eubacteriales bacterium]
MNTYIVLACILGAALLWQLALRLWARKCPARISEYQEKASKGLSVALFFVYVLFLFIQDNFRDVRAMQGSLYDTRLTVWLLVLRWLTVLSGALCIIAPFFEKRSAQDFLAFVPPFVVAANILSLDYTLNSAVGTTKLTTPYALLLLAQLVLISLIWMHHFARAVRKKPQNPLQRAGKVLGLVLLYALPFMPVYALELLFGPGGQKTADFTLTHRLLIYSCFVIPVVAYVATRKQSIKERKFLLVMLSLSGFVQYFYDRSFHLTSLPLHLCNTAIVLMFVAFVFQIKSVFYFTYLVNVLGAFLAVVLPNHSTPLFQTSAVAFWYNHIYAFILPIMGVALGVFGRTNFKAMKKAIGAFTGYFVVVAFLNAWINNYYKVDYFFLYGSTYTDKFAFVIPLKSNYIWTIQMGNTPLKFFWLYQLLVYVIFTGLMFVIWGIYAYLFKVSDAHKELAKRRLQAKVDTGELMKEMRGRPLSEPLRPEGVGMIKFHNFSKIYSGSTVKAVDNFSLEVYGGEIFGFLGHNGAGKSTTIKSLVGIQPITEGRIEVEGYDVARQSLEAKLHIGYVSDNHAVYEKLTGREYINYVADLYMVDEEQRKVRLNKYLQMFALEDAVDREIKGYSHGMKQKIMVISALIHNPAVWVLDEPLTGLDPTSSYQIKQCMMEHAAAGNIVFFSSHVIEVVEKICDRVAIISGGVLRQVSTMDEIRASGKSLEETYLQYGQENEKSSTAT